MSAIGYFAHTRREMLAFMPLRYERVLEIGCGEGAFAAQLDPTADTWGVEVDESAASRARTRMSEVLSGRYEDVQHRLPNGYFDVVVCNDVIEHMEAPDAFLESAISKLRANGWLVASVPNMRFAPVLLELLVRKDWRYRESGVLDRTHLRFYTEKSIRRLIEDRGLDIERFQGLSRTMRAPVAASAYLAVLLTMGIYRDILFHRFGLRARTSE